MCARLCPLCLCPLLKICAYNMPPADIEGLRETFEAIDKDHSGTISLEELTNHLQVICVFVVFCPHYRKNRTASQTEVSCGGCCIVMLDG